MVGVEILQRSEPYHIPGYTGYCPQHQFKYGKTFSELSHTLLTDPTVAHADKLVLVDRKQEHEVVKPVKADIEIVNSRSDRIDPVYKHPMLPTYDGFIPNLNDERDKPYGAVATEGIANFERQQLKKKASLEKLRKTLELQSGSKYPETSEDLKLLKSKYRLPLIKASPECSGLPDYSEDEKYERPEDYNASPYFMNNDNPQKYFVHGYTGYKPHSSTHFGKTHQPMTNYGLRDFTTDYLERKRLEWAPVIITKKKELPVKSDNKIYKKDTALMPSYTGHIPGAQFKIGKTHGFCSKDAHRYLEEQLFSLEYSNCPPNKKKLIN